MTINPIRSPRATVPVRPATPPVACYLEGTCNYCGGHRPANGVPSIDHVVRGLLATHQKQCDHVAAHGARDEALEDQVRTLLTELAAAANAALVESVVA